MTTSGTNKPSLLAILICERIMFDDDAVPSLFRIIDEFRLEIAGGTPEARGQVTAVVNCVVFTKWGLGEGQFTQELRIVLPDTGEERRGGEPMLFTKPSGFHFVQTRHQVRFSVRTEGIYAFRVYLDGQPVGEHPFKVTIVRQDSPQ